MLAHGIDGLVLSVDVTWGERDPFEELDRLKTYAADHEAPCPGVAKFGNAEPPESPESPEPPWIFNVAPHGVGGYAWLLTSKEVTLKVGSWREPMSRPSVVAEIRSESLWTRGAQAMVRRVRAILQGWGAEIAVVRVSRVDLCADVLLREDDWSLDLLDAFTTRAQDINSFLHCRRLTGFQIGKGKMMARLYDKPAEIEQKSHKFWMYRVWGIGAVPDGVRVIRVEFQFRRDAIKRLSVDTFDDLMASLPALWAYASRDWLKVQDGTGPHHTQKTTRPWWEVVQGAFEGAMEAEPAIRQQAISDDAGRLLRSMLGYVSSYAALKQGHSPVRPGACLSLASLMEQARLHLAAMGVTDEEFTDKVKAKHAMHARLNDKLRKNTGVNGADAVA